MDKLKFKPAYNPYTEPSMEIFGYHEGWSELVMWLRILLISYVIEDIVN